MIIEYIGPSCSGKTSQIEATYSHVEITKGSPKIILSRALKFKMIAILGDNICKILISFYGIWKYKPSIKIYEKNIYFKIKIYMNLSYRLGMIFFLEKMNDLTEVIVIDEGPKHIPFTLFNCKLTSPDPFIAFNFDYGELRCLTASYDILRERLEKRGHWRVKPDNFEEFLIFNINVEEQLRIKLLV